MRKDAYAIWCFGVHSIAAVSLFVLIGSVTMVIDYLIGLGAGYIKPVFTNTFRVVEFVILFVDLYLFIVYFLKKAVDLKRELWSQ